MRLGFPRQSNLKRDDIAQHFVEALAHLRQQGAVGEGARLHGKQPRRSDGARAPERLRRPLRIRAGKPQVRSQRRKRAAVDAGKGAKLRRKRLHRTRSSIISTSSSCICNGHGPRAAW